MYVNGVTHTWQVARLSVEEPNFHPVLPQVSTLSYYIVRGRPGALTRTFPALLSASLRDWPALSDPTPLTGPATPVAGPSPGSHLPPAGSATAPLAGSAAAGAGPWVVPVHAQGRTSRGHGRRASSGITNQGRPGSGSGEGAGACDAGHPHAGVQHLTLLQHTTARVVQPWGDLGPRMKAHTEALKSLTSLRVGGVHGYPCMLAACLHDEWLASLLA